MIGHLKKYLIFIGAPVLLFALLWALSVWLTNYGGCTFHQGTYRCQRGPFYGDLNFLLGLSMMFLPYLYMFYVGVCTLIMVLLIPHALKEAKRAPSAKPTRLHVRIILAACAVCAVAGLAVTVKLQMDRLGRQSLAVASGDISQCAKASNPGKCYGAFAAAKEDPKICMKNGGFSDTSCFESYAEHVSTAGGCVKLDSIEGLQDFKQMVLDRATSACALRFAKSNETKEFCHRAWAQERFAPLVMSSCWNHIDPNAKSKTGYNLLMMAAKLGNGYPDQKIEELVKITKNPNDSNQKGETALHLVTGFSNIDKLIEGGANPNAQDSAGLTPPMRWIKENVGYLSTERIEKNLQQGWDPKVQDFNGNTYLHHIALRAPKKRASRNLSLENDRERNDVALKLLREAGADLKIHNKDGFTPEALARQQGREWIFSPAQ